MKSKQKSEQKFLYVDPKDLRLDDEDSFSVHPSKLSWLSSFENAIFDTAIIRNVPSSSLKSLCFFYIAKVVKPNGIVDVYVDQPISVMQSLDASEIEANAKLAGFVDFQQLNYEKWVREADGDKKFSTIRITMIRPEKIGAATGRTPISK